MTILGEPIYKTPFEKATAIAEAIVHNHVFNDANHRTALAAAHLVLGLHDLQLVADQREQVDNIRGLRAGTVTMADFGQWLEQNCILRSQPPQ